MISPGDVVECISTTAPCSCSEPLGSLSFPAPVLRRVYRVAEAAPGMCPRCGAEQPLLQSACQRHPVYAWPQSCFRRITPATEDIFSLATTRIPEPVS